MGDQAIAIATIKWIKDNFNEVVIEVRLIDIYKYISSIKKIINNDDIIFFHGGGNIGDRYLSAENARRFLLKTFPNNKIISFPQTIYFSNSKEGKIELEKSKSIYNGHKNFTIMTRDQYSLSLANNYFPNCKPFNFPDMVLYLNNKFNRSNQNRGKILVCLRNDIEKNTNNDFNQFIFDLIKNKNLPFTTQDTFLDRKPDFEERENLLSEILDIFSKHKAVITDRFHGVIFSVITKTPCIVLKSSDHKIAEGVKWFAGLNYVFYVGEDFKMIPQKLEQALKLENLNDIDWDKEYFNNLKNIILDK